MNDKKPISCPFCGVVPKEWMSDTPVPFSLYDVRHSKKCFLYRSGARYEGPDRIATLHKSDIAAWNRRVK